MVNQRNSLLWRVSHSEAVAGDSFLFGSMHVRDRRAFSNLQQVYQSIDATEKYFAEMDLNVNASLSLSQSWMLPAGVTLETLVGIAKYRKINRMIRKSFDIDLDHYQKLIPFVVTNVITEQIFVNHNSQPLDYHLYNYAVEKGKIAGGLETAEEQMAIMDQIPISYQVKTLLSMARNPSKFRKQVRRLLILYEKEELDKLYRISRKGMGDVKRLLLYERNRLFASRFHLEALAKPIFCAIGAAHLPGEKGVLRLLKKKGFIVKPVK